MTRASLGLHGIVVCALAALAGCSSDGGKKESTHLAQGYLATDACSQHTTETDCDATERGCQWVYSGGAACPGATPGDDTPVNCISLPATGVCVANDPCLALSKSACASNTACAWSSAATLCPVGATCDDGGFCHSMGDSGTDCACVSPISSNADGTVLPVECDCSGGGSTSGSGGACACACPACAPGDVCPPCDCNCDDGGPTCTGGGTTVTTTTVDPCGSHHDFDSCKADTQNACGVVPGPGGAFVCASGNISDSDPPTICNCPICPADAPCAPCNCGGSSTDGGTSTTCTVPPTPTQPVACPAIACADLNCANGTKTGSDGCPTCTCN